MDGLLPSVENIRFLLFTLFYIIFSDIVYHVINRMIQSMSQNYTVVFIAQFVTPKKKNAIHLGTKT